jgi:hypothetical protein
MDSQKNESIITMQSRELTGAPNSASNYAKQGLRKECVCVHLQKNRTGANRQVTTLKPLHSVTQHTDFNKAFFTLSVS